MRFKETETTPMRKSAACMTFVGQTSESYQNARGGARALHSSFSRNGNPISLLSDNH